MTDNGLYDYPVTAFTEGLRVELHPATDLWMTGARYGSVVSAGRTRVTVKLDSRPHPVTIPRTHLKPVDS
jgi:hypothetical protein